ncbi:MAG: ferrous iron transport protein B [Bdellovibrionaceae bacterium]|nr:ferrous iron transport protein B [Bdellovibrionales bacterium]MCB9253918.1 ferrous iron transport protein B [Pseudobdellovibrionaceae bacterium]
MNTPATVPAPLVALTGNPNCGKTALFNALTGNRQKVANYPGVTVERREGIAVTPKGHTLKLLDLPGTYSLDPKSPDEEIALEVLLNKRADVEAPSVLVAVADATNLERCLNFVLEIRALGKPVVLALNMMDLAENRGIELDLVVLEKELLIPVVPTIAVRKEGTATLLDKVEEALARVRASQPVQIVWHRPSPDELRARFTEVDRIMKLATKSKGRAAEWTRRIDDVVLHPWFGHVILLTIMAFMFQAVFAWAEPFMDLIEAGVESFGVLASGVLPEGPLQSLLVDGIIAGVGSVLVFLPQILILFLFILILEDSGYMARAAFLMDRSMGKVGLHGRAFIPLLSSFACAIPGIMATRTISNRRDRLATIFIAPLMTCSARLPVYALLIAAFIPNATVFGFFGLQGLVLLGLYLIGIAFALIVAWVLKKTSLRGPAPSFMMELPTYKRPSVRNIGFGLWERAKIFLRRAGKYILITSMILWGLASFPKAPENATEPAIQYSLAGKIGNAIEPVLRPLGFDWRIATGLIPGFAAREVMVSSLATVFAVESEDEGEVERSLVEKLQTAWPLPTALALLVWYVFSPQCLATFAVTKRETNSWLWTGANFLTLLVMAYVFAMLTYQIGTVLLSA